MGYFDDPTLNTLSKSAIFEFLRVAILLCLNFFFWGGGYFADPTLNTLSKSATFEFSGVGGGGGWGGVKAVASQIVSCGD